MLRALIVLLVLATAAMLLMTWQASKPPVDPPAEPAQQQAQPVWRAGVHWLEIELPGDVRRQAGERIPVVYVFSYAATGAHTLEPGLRGWVRQLPADVEFSRIAAPIGAEWRRHARNYYALRASNAGDALQMRMFEVVARRPQAVLTPTGVVREVLPGGDAAAFRSAFASAEVVDQVATAARLLEQWQLADVPALVIDNRYVVLLSSVGVSRMFEVADLLLARVRLARASTAG